MRVEQLYQNTDGAGRVYGKIIGKLWKGNSDAQG